MLTRLHHLPFTVHVILLLFASTALAESVSSNDPFRAIALQTPKRPEPPICDLKSQSQLDTVEDDVLLSFEEWKVKQLKLQTQTKIKQTAQDKSNNSAAPPSSGSPTVEGTKQDPAPAVHQEGVPQTYEELASIPPADTVLPHFQVPTTDRFNYASNECTARVHAAHRSAKSATSILSSKKDRYMLSPCKTPNNEKFVIVELCDDIRIDTLQLANYEFFSGVFKDFSVTVAKTYTDSEGWTHAGTYRAKNVRGVQTFRFPESLRDFYRYIRIDFHSYYGNEYYCPVSLLRVYGLTHLEEWKWDIWMAESRAKQIEALKGKPLAISAQSADETAEPIIPEESSRIPTPLDTLHPTIDPAIVESLASLSKQAATLTEVAFGSLSSVLSEGPGSLHSTQLPPKPSAVAMNPSRDDSRSLDSQTLSHSTDTITGSSSELPNSSSTIVLSSAIAEAPRSSVGSSSSVSVMPVSSPSDVSSDRGPNESSSHRATSHTSSPIIILSSPSVLPSLVTGSAPSHVPTGGESVYRTIMNKLTALETNYTLYTRYMDQQNSAIRELIKRLVEDIGRLEGVTRVQRTNSQKMLIEWEKQRLQMMIDYGQLLSRVEHLSEEILLEKRLGVAQLCLMLAILVFMGLTRGSRGESIVINGQASMREWGKRHLSLSGDWTSRFRRKNSITVPTPRSRSSTAKPSPIKPVTSLPSEDERIQFPRKEVVSARRRPLETLQLNNNTPLTASRVANLSHSRSRTPSLRNNGTGKRTIHTPHPPPPVTPTPARALHLRPQMLQRSSSQGAQFSTSRANRSVKKWARTAHLHPVKSPAFPQANSEGYAQSQDSGSAVTEDFDFSDVFSAPAGSFDFPRSATQLSNPTQSPKTKGYWDGENEAPSHARWKRQYSDGRGAKFESAEDGDGDSNWIDTDSVVDSDLDPDSIPSV